MSNNKKVFIVVGIIILVGVSFLIGLFVGKSNFVKPDLLTTTYGQTFYATIEQIRDNKYISVKGLDVNDINYRGEFSLTIKDSTNMTWRGESINISDLDVGDTISITFSDEILMSIYPTPIKDVERIQLLDDEK